MKGFPLKTVGTTVTTSGKKGKASTSTSTTEVTLLEQTSVSGKLFKLDPSFEEVPMMPTAGAMPQADPQEEPEEQEEEEGGRFKKWKKKIGG